MMAGKLIKKGVITVLMVMIALLQIAGTVCAQDEITNQTILIEKSISTLQSFVVDKNMEWFREHIKDSYGIIIIPQLLKGGFIFGGAGGRAVLLGRDELTGEWSQPVFLTSIGVSFGLQIGGKTSEVIVLVRTLKGMEEFYTSSVNLGAEASIAVGPIGATGEAATAPSLKADYLSFAKSKGAFAGLSLNGSNMRINDKWNSEYYGREVRPVEIIVTHEVTNPKSDKLINAVIRAQKIK
jgi:lipid-binding SYLF domain-containing protein